MAEGEVWDEVVVVEVCEDRKRSLKRRRRVSRVGSYVENLVPAWLGE